MWEKPASTPPVIARNLTSTFIRFRHDRRGGRAGAGILGDNLEQRPLRGDDPRLDTTIEMSSLPPQWVELAQEARDDLKGIKEKMKELAKAQNRRLLKVFGDDNPDKEVESIASAISSTVRRCEQTIHQIKTRGGAGSDSDRDTRLNVQRGLATQLQGCSQDFRTSQKEYLNKIRQRQGGSLFDDGPANGGASGSKGSADFGFSDGQLLELEQMETNAGQRNTEICQIASSITDLHTIFKELAVLVIDQGSILDRIDYNIEAVVHQSREANVQLQKAEKSAKSNRAMKCISLLVLFNVIMILVLILKARH